MTPDRQDGTLVLEKGGEMPFQTAPEQQEAQPAATMPEAEPASEQKPRERVSNKELLNLIIQTGDNAKDYAVQIVDKELERETFDQDWRLAKVFAMSEEFDGQKKKSREAAIATAMAKIQIGRSWGIGAADSMRFVYLTNGKPNVEGQLLAAKLQRAGYDWDVAYHRDKNRRCNGVTIFPKRLNAQNKYESMTMREFNEEGKMTEVPLSLSFTHEDAEAAMIYEGGKQIRLADKWNFKSWPEDMYFWRALGRFHRRHAPHILTGAMLRDEAQEAAPEQPQVAKPLFAGKESAA